MRIVLHLFIYFFKHRLNWFYEWCLFKLKRNQGLFESGRPVSSLEKKPYVIFIHVPKAAGSSIKTSFRNVPNFLDWEHRSYYAFKYLLGAQYFQSFSFAFVRNPWDRLVSEYFFIKKRLNPLHQAFYDRYLSKYSTFSDFVNDWLSINNIFSYNFFIPQCHFITNSEQKIMVDYVARFENIESEIKVLSEKIGHSIELSHYNKTEHDDYRSYYSQSAKEKVLMVYQKDIDLFQYEF